MKDKQDDSSDENNWRIEMKESMEGMGRRMEVMEKKRMEGIEGIEKTLNELARSLIKKDPSYD